ncbi:MAG: guanylate kinase [archaeon]
MLVILSGSSGVGKNTLIDILRQAHKDIVLMPTLTTRNKRYYEQEGNPFYYLSKTDFEKKIKNNELFEYEKIHDNLYGSSKEVYDKYNKQGKVLIKDIGVEGAQNLSNIINQHDVAIKIFLYTINKFTLKKRLFLRKEKNITKRLKRFSYEQSQKNFFDFLILNHNRYKSSYKIKQAIEFSSYKYKEYYYIKKIKLNYKKLEKYINLIKKGKNIGYISGYIYGNKFIIKKGLEKYLATKLYNKDIAKKILYKKKIKTKKDIISDTLLYNLKKKYNV